MIRPLLLFVCALAAVTTQAAPLDPNAFTSLGTFNPGSNVTVNTDTLAMTGGVSGTGVNASGVAVFTFTSVTLNNGISVTATGSRPFALLSRGAMTISGTIDVSATGSNGGAGGFAGNTTLNGGSGLGPGAGGGDSQGCGGAGHGGVGGSTTAGAVAGIAYGNLATTLQGGSGGGRGTFFVPSGSGGGGGGALELGAVNTLTVSSTGILRANGAAGAPFPGNQTDGGGGGSGGGLYLHGSTTHLNAGAELRADGGAGGIGGTQGIGGGGGAGGRIRAENVGTNAATVSVAGGAGSTGTFGNGLPGNAGEALLIGTPSVTISQSAGNTSVVEAGGTDTYTVVLGAQPSGNVTITISPDAQVSVSPSTLTFTTANWASAQTVTVSAVNDAIAEGIHTGIITHSASGGGYNGVSIGSVEANITDNDTAGVTLTQSSGITAVTEGGFFDTYTLVLTSQPTASVTISITPDSQLGVNVTSRTFTTSNWNTPQTVLVSAIDDAIAEGTHSGSLAHSASGGGYNGVSIAGITASITDNDTASVSVVQSGGSTDVSEAGSTDTYTLVLGSQPTASVSITLNSDANVNVSPNSVTFTSGNWNQAQTITVSAINDAVAEGAHTGSITHAASGGGYTGVSVAAVTANIADNDTAGVQITQSGGLTELSESGAQDTYTAVLTSQPTSTVTLSVLVDAQLQAIAPLQYTPSNWNQPQTVTVRAVDDQIAEGTHPGQIAHQASGGGYDSVSVAGIQATIADNDVVGVTVSESAGGTAVAEAGSSDTYGLTLLSEPTGTVTIQLQPDADLQVSPTSLQFNASNWNLAQNIVVSAVDDAIAEGSHLGEIQHTVSGANFAGTAVPNLSVTISDNDTAGGTLSESNGSTVVTEGGSGDTYQLVLNSEPTGTVTVQIQGDSQLNTTPVSTLQFTSSNWDVPQTVNVQAVDDAVFEGSHSGLIQHVAQGGGYDAVVVPGLTVDIADNDIQAVDLSIVQNLLTPLFGPGERIRFEIHVEHLSINTLPGTAQVQLSTSAELGNLSWICAADPGANCPSSGSGPIAHLINLSTGTGVTYVVAADVALNAPTGTSLSTTATVTANHPDADQEPANNQSALSFQVGIDRVFRDGFDD